MKPRWLVVMGALVLLTAVATEGKEIGPKQARVGSPYAGFDNTAGLPLNADPALSTVPAAASGTAFTFPQDDGFVDLTASQLPFAVGVYGNFQQNVRVYDNGYLKIGAAGGNPDPSEFDNTGLPAGATSLSGNTTVFALWDDLHPKSTSRVHVLVQGTTPTRTATIQWTDMAHVDDLTASYTFAVTFFEAVPGEVLIRYGAMTNGAGSFADGRSATIGIQSGSNSFEVACNRTGAIAAGRNIDLATDDDRDGLARSLEDKNRNGTLNEAGESNPNVFDTDGGGVGDGGEFFAGTNPSPTAVNDDNFQDQDSDRISDQDETAVFATSPSVADTDGDGLKDGEEVRTSTAIPDISGTDPLVADTDRDGLRDGAEDPDHDSVLDPGETNPNSSDTDGDGFSDGLEVVEGTDPRISSSVPDLSNIVVGRGLSIGAMHAHAAFDRNNNIHIVWADTRGGSSGTPNNAIHYAMLSSTGTVKISDTLFFVRNASAIRYTRVVALSSGKVGIVSCEGDGKTGFGIRYMLLDPSLDDQDGNQAFQRIRVVNLDDVNAPIPPSGASDTNHHVEAAVDSQDDVHVVYEVNGGQNRSTFPKEVRWARIDGKSGVLEAGPIAVLRVQGQLSSSESNRGAQHFGKHPRVVIDRNDNAVIAMRVGARIPNGSGGTTPSFIQAPAIAVVSRDGVVTVPPVERVTTAGGTPFLRPFQLPLPTGHFYYGIDLNSAGEIGLAGQGIPPGNSSSNGASLLYGRVGSNSSVTLPFRPVDGPGTSAPSGDMPRAPDLAFDAQDRAMILYWERRNDRDYKIVQVDRQGVVIGGPARIGTRGSGSSRRGVQPALAVNAARDKMVALFDRHSPTPRTLFARIIDPNEPAIDPCAASRLDKTKGGLVQTTDGEIVFSLPANSVSIAGTTTADAVLDCGGGGAPPSGFRRIVTGGVRLKGGATFAGTATVTFGVPDTFNGSLNDLSLFQVDGNKNFVGLGGVTRDVCRRTLSASVTNLRTVGLLERDLSQAVAAAGGGGGGGGGCAFGGAPAAALPWAALLALLAVARRIRREHR